jgi:ssDNA-binding Zn-finger/Zn-ribbon topoisomerase 1
MSFKCSVFGHRYGDPEVEREREEQGSEVVITITETETCKRCGEQRVVSENKEVTTLETPSDIVGDDMPDESQESDDPKSSQPEPDVGSVETSVAEQAPETTDDATAESERTTEPAVDDGTADDDPAAWPQEDDDPEEDDAVILDDGSDDDDSDGRAPGEWPTEDDDDDDDWTPGTGQGLRPVEDEQPDVEPTADAVTVPEGEFYCPECEFTTDVEASSLRAGDFCPECHRGSLTHRQTEQ